MIVTHTGDCGDDGDDDRWNVCSDQHGHNSDKRGNDAGEGKTGNATTGDDRNKRGEDIDHGTYQVIDSTGDHGVFDDDIHDNDDEHTEHNENDQNADDNDDDDDNEDN